MKISWVTKPTHPLGGFCWNSMSFASRSLKIEVSSASREAVTSALEPSLRWTVPETVVSVTVTSVRTSGPCFTNPTNSEYVTGWPPGFTVWNRMNPTTPSTTTHTMRRVRRWRAPCWLPPLPPASNPENPPRLVPLLPLSSAMEIHLPTGSFEQGPASTDSYRSNSSRDCVPFRPRRNGAAGPWDDDPKEDRGQENGEQQARLGPGRGAPGRAHVRARGPGGSGGRRRRGPDQRGRGHGDLGGRPHADP